MTQAKPSISAHSSITSKEASDYAWRHLQSVTETIRLADTKAGTLLAIGGVLEGIILRVGPVDIYAQENVMGSILSILAAVFIGLSVVSSIRVLLPRLKTHARGSLLYFGRVASAYKSESSEFRLKYHELMHNQGALFDELANQVWANSKIAQRKLQIIRQAIWWLAIGILVLGISIPIQAVVY